ncbi:MAG: recombinase family protein [Pseudomonadota bacterium]
MEPGEAAIVERLYKEFSSGRYGMGALIKRVDCELSPSGAEGILSNIFYTGRVRYSGQVRWNKHPAIIGDRLFNKVQRVRQQRARSESAQIVKVVEGKPETMALSAQR